MKNIEKQWEHEEIRLGKFQNFCVSAVKKEKVEFMNYSLAIELKIRR